MLFHLLFFDILSPSYFLIFDVFASDVFSVSTFCPSWRFSLRPFVTPNVFSIRCYVFSTFCQSIFFTVEVFYFEILSVNRKDTWPYLNCSTIVRYLDDLQLLCHCTIVAHPEPALSWWDTWRTLDCSVMVRYLILPSLSSKTSLLSFHCCL
jgi:hypothetical protein